MLESLLSPPKFKRKCWGYKIVWVILTEASNDSKRKFIKLLGGLNLMTTTVKWGTGVVDLRCCAVSWCCERRGIGICHHLWCPTHQKSANPLLLNEVFQDNASNPNQQPKSNVAKNVPAKDESQRYSTLPKLLVSFHSSKTPETFS